MPDRNFTILNQTITTAESITVVERGNIPGGIAGLTASAVFTVGGGGTTAKAFIQTSLDEGETWIDIICLAFTTSSENKVATVSSTTPLITGTPVDGNLADNTIFDGVIGSMLRAKYVTTGTYTGVTTLKIDIKLHDTANMLTGAGGVDWALYDATNDKTPVIFSNTSTALINIVPIDSTRILFVYRADSFFCRAKIVSYTFEGLVDTQGTEVVILADTTLDIKADLLDSTHAIIAVESGGDVKCIAIEFSGTSITTVGSAVSTETVNSNHIAIAAVSSSEFFVAYEDNGDTNGTVYYATVSGTTVTMGNGIDFETLDIVDLNMCKLASGTCLIGAGHGGADDGEVYLISQTANTPQVDDQITLVNGAFNVDSIGAHRIDDNTAIFCWTETASTTDCTAAIITESGGTLSKGTNEQYSTDIAEEQSIALPNSTQAVITFGVDSAAMKSVVLEISGSTLNALTVHTNETTDKEHVTNGAMGTDFVVAGYEDDNDASKGYFKVLTV